MSYIVLQKTVFLQSKYNIMTAYTIRIDNETKNQFDLLCKRLGLSVSTAFNLFIRKSLREQAIPFRIDLNSSSMVMENAKRAIDEMRAASAQKRVKPTPYGESVVALPRVD